MRKILVTGANGFVCSNIIDVLLERDWYVYATDRTLDNPAIDRWPSDQVNLIEGDIDALPALPVDALLHGAAITASANQRGEMPEDNFAANLDPALSMMRYAANNEISRAIFVSSSAVYQSTEPGYINEDVLTSPLGCYAVAKSAIEGMVATLRHNYGRDIVCIRLGNLYGPHEFSRDSRPNTSMVDAWITQAIQGAIHIKQSTKPREWTFVRDVGAAVSALLDAPHLSHALYHVAAGKVYTAQQIAQAIQATFSKQSVDLIYEVDDTPDPLTRLGTLVSNRLEADTGFNAWTSLEAGIRQTVDARLKEVGRA